MSNFDFVTLDHAHPCGFDDHICPEPSAIDLLDEARLLLRVLAESLHDDMARAYQAQVASARIAEAMTRLRQPAEA